MLIIVGLGNPSAEYENTFHNMGFMAVDKLAQKLNKKIKKAECFALTAAFSAGGEKIVLAKPMTYMNLSGDAVKSLAAKYKATSDEIIIIYDDFDIPRFTLRARSEGSGGSHKGMKHIIEKLGTQAIKRVRIGIGKEDREAKDYVLSKIKKEDEAAFGKTFDALAEFLSEYIKTRDFDAFIRDCALYAKSAD
ncbi:MAG: aminoacyl-tRNA hydrolase [Clostridiales bacterium]|jgi:PTH1 family peptidyl-tRNA hydrolase|nr:aminoacyl-tRNA hydrolase [Clostridiales bacterium]HOB63609.1 aminoacyl-tRNA hydrolase [Clostridia bacterium]HOK82018.1 aminoacyl-tRNA hydrolase [Clostridia bacterium]HOL61453.1 aminoacyl-tRNA hydrolase [Clostridia bacterium]HPO53687.1 aminoacyl-tRNA hydrolase [Clostridia bacterium]